MGLKATLRQEVREFIEMISELRRGWKSLLGRNQKHQNFRNKDSTCKTLRWAQA